MKYAAAILSLLVAAPLAVRSGFPIEKGERILKHMFIGGAGDVYIWQTLLGYHAFTVMTLKDGDMWSIQKFDKAAGHASPLDRPVASGFPLADLNRAELATAYNEIVAGSSDPNYWFGKYSILGERRSCWRADDKLLVQTRH